VTDPLDGLVATADLDGLLRAAVDLSDAGDWEGLWRLRQRCRAAVETGRQLWPAAAHADHRLALLAPASWAVRPLESPSRFGLGPLTEVLAQRHQWSELSPLVPPGADRALVAHERALRGDRVGREDGWSEVLDLPADPAGWEPVYPLATYHPDHAEFPAPPLPPMTAALPRRGSGRVDEAVDLAVRQLVEPWLVASEGTAVTVCADGDHLDALGALPDQVAGITPRVGALDGAAAVAWLAWAGASGGGHGRRRGAAVGRFGAWWTVAALAGVLDDWPVATDRMGELVAELHWWWWDRGAARSGWNLDLLVEDPVDGLAWAIACHDPAMVAGTAALSG
jgi:hypothetical protein